MSSANSGGRLSAQPKCNELVGGDECRTEEEEMLTKRSRYISYGALKMSNVPCNQPGNSYYSCDAKPKANPYHCGCSAITHFKRYTG
ncbi:hypothetical protein QYF36_003159 [Acer negundo]|nr:hypothetical protein QYF36_003159 [Acer negundo]